jgi:flagellar hook protein FlgE
MSLYGTMGTAISGMAAQANWLSSVGDNIANASTVGYKDADTQFSTLLGNSSPGSYQSGGVTTTVRYGVSEQGVLQSTSTVTNLAIKGNGFFVVNSPAGTTALTRAGDFVPDASGNLVNTAGYFLMGYDISNGSTATGANALVKVNVSQGGLQAIPSTTATVTGNLPSTATANTTSPIPSSNDPASVYTDKTSIVAYDDLGAPVTLDVYMTKTADQTWDVAVFNQADAAPGGGFPYTAAASSSEPVQTGTLVFDPTTGKLDAANSTLPAAVQIPNGNAVPIDFSQMTQLAAGYSGAATADGSAPSTVDHIQIANDGTLSTVYANGYTTSNYKIPLATVASPDSLTEETGNVYETNSQSGNMVLGSADSAGYGAIDSSALENSTVDLATELSNMIVAQRGYEANSKVLQTGAELLHVLTQMNT